MPSLTYQAYQLACLNDQGQIIYNTNLQQGTETKQNIASLSVGVHDKKVRIAGQVWAANIKACSAQVYFIAGVGTSAQVLAHLPMNIAATNSAHFLKSMEIKGTLSLKSSAPLSQSSIISINETTLGTYPYSFAGNFKDSGANTFTLDSLVFYSKPEVSTSTTSFIAFTAEYQISSEVFNVEANLIDKLRAFIPIFMYLSLFLWWVVVSPLIDWMLRNRVYSAKPIAQKFKQQ